MIEQLEPRRMLSAGDLDPTFGVRGIAAVNNEKISPALAPDGGIVYVARDPSGADKLARLLSDGTADASFGDNGFVPLAGKANAIVTDPGTGRVAVLSIHQAKNAQALDVAMYNANGQTDTTFDGDGIAEIRYGFEPFTAPVTVFDSAGDLYVAVTSTAQSGRWVGPVVFRFTPGGLDSNFGDGGGVDFPTKVGGIASLATQGQKVVVLGNYYHAFEEGDGSEGAETKMTFLRLNADGSVDQTFAVDPRLTTVYSDSPIDGDKLVARPDGTLFLLDREYVQVYDYTQISVYHFDANGAQLEQSLPAVSDSGEDDLVVQSDGKAIVSIISKTAAGYETVLQRSNSDGTADLSYGVQSMAHVPEGVVGLQIDAQDRIVMGLFGADGIERTQAGPGRLRAGAQDAVLDQGILDIAGTNGADVLSLSSEATNILVTINGHASSFAASTVHAIEVRAGDGNDSVMIGAGVPGTFVFGGDGNDTLRGGDGNDTLTGGGGRDLIFGGAGNDRLNGNGGNDTISGDSGNDRIYGGNGNDSLYGGSGTDRLYGEAGDDYLKGDKGADRLDGGDGTNHATADDDDALIGSILS